MSRAKKPLSEALFDILADLGDAIALVSTTQRSLEQQEIAGDEISSLRVAVKMLVAVHQGFNKIADVNEPVTPRMPGIGETEVQP